MDLSDIRRAIAQQSRDCDGGVMEREKMRVDVLADLLARVIHLLAEKYRMTDEELAELIRGW